MTMNMPSYSQGQSYLQGPSQGYINAASQSNLNSFETLRHPQQSSSNLNVNRSFSPNITPYFNTGRSYSPLNGPQNVKGPQVVREIPTQIPVHNLGGQYISHQVEPGPYQQVHRSNNFIRQPQMHPQQGYFGGHSVYPQQYIPAHYQPVNYVPYQPQQPHHVQYYPQVVPQNYAPVYAGTFVNGVYGQQPRKNVPEQSINSNFNYENANFDCNYSVQENLVHCVLCNQTYKTSQKKQHLQLHREKAKNVDIKPVDKEQLRKLQKSTALLKKNLVYKPVIQQIVQPLIQPIIELIEPQIPNESVMRQVVQQNLADKNSIQIQTEDPRKWSRPQDLGYSESRRSQASSPERGSRMNRAAENPASNERQSSRQPVANRNTNTRFNGDSVRVEEQIFLSERFENNNGGEDFKSNYKGDQSSMRDSDRRSQASLGFQDSPSLKARNVESIESPEVYGYEQGSRLESIKEENEEHRKSNNQEILINEIVKAVHRESQY